MDLPVASDSVHLSAYQPRLPLSVANGKASPGGFDESGYYHYYGDGGSVASHGSGALTGYETLDSPPHNDFYANTEVWGRRRRFRPSLYQLYAKPEVGISFVQTSVATPLFRQTKQRRPCCCSTEMGILACKFAQYDLYGHPFSQRQNEAYFTKID